MTLDDADDMAGPGGSADGGADGAADEGADHFSNPSSSQKKPSWQRGMKMNRWEPLRTMSLPDKSRRGSISASFTYVPFVELWSIKMNRRSSGRKTRSA